MSRAEQVLVDRPVPSGSGRQAIRSEDGFTMIEALMSIFILTLIALSLGQLVGIGMLSNKTAADLTQATNLSGTKLEQLRNSDYELLAAGGALDEDVDNYNDSIDTNGDGTADFHRRWSVVDQTGGKTVQVRTVALKDSIGPAKAATMATVVGER